MLKEWNGMLLCTLDSEKSALRYLDPSSWGKVVRWVWKRVRCVCVCIVFWCTVDGRVGRGKNTQSQVVVDLLLLS